MAQFRLLLIAITVVIVVFTIAAVANDGWDLLPHFFDPIVELSWQGQFNVDFITYLILSGVWMAWRGGFTGVSIGLGLFAPLLGILFLDLAKLAIPIVHPQPSLLVEWKFRTNQKPCRA